MRELLRCNRFAFGKMFLNKRRQTEFFMVSRHLTKLQLRFVSNAKSFFNHHRRHDNATKYIKFEFLCE